MSKLICFRVDDEQKARIEAAASIQNKSVTTFVKENVMRAVENVESRLPKQTKRLDLFGEVEDTTPEKVEPRPPKQTKRRAAVPPWFRALCHEAARGGSFGFHRVGYRWASNMPPGTPPGFAYAEWQEQVDDIRKKIEIALLMRVGGKKWRQAVNESILAWFRKNFPSQIDLIPIRRQSEFAEGFLDAGEDTIRMRGK
jgi:hypothetical protein